MCSFDRGDSEHRRRRAADASRHHKVIFPKHLLAFTHTATTSLLINPPGKQQYMYRFAAADSDCSIEQAQIVPKFWEPNLPLTTAGADFPTIVGSNEDLRTRILGVRFGPNTAATSTEAHALALGAKYQALFASDTATAFDARTCLGYDAAWTLLLAISATAAQSKDLTPDNISPNVKPRLRDGATEYSPDAPANMANAIALLRSGGSINYTGASGKCDWDDNNDAEPTIGSWCVTPTTNNNKIAGAGFAFDTTKKVITGSVTCFGTPGDGGVEGGADGGDAGAGDGGDAGDAKTD